MSKFRRVRPNHRRRSKKALKRLRGQVGLGVVLIGLLGLNIYVFFLRGGTSVYDLMRASAHQATTLQPIDNDTQEVGDAGDKRETDRATLLRGSMKGHLALSSALSQAGISTQAAYELIEKLRERLNMKQLLPSHTFELVLDPKTGAVTRLSYALSPSKRIELERDSTGQLQFRGNDPAK